MDECVVFCEVWGLTEYLILGVLILGPIIGASYAIYEDEELAEVIACGVAGFLASLVLILILAFWQMFLITALLIFGLPVGVWFISKGIKGLRK